jgi:hypothetical protein
MMDVPVRGYFNENVGNGTTGSTGIVVSKIKHAVLYSMYEKNIKLNLKNSGINGLIVFKITTTKQNKTIVYK